MVKVKHLLFTPTLDIGSLSLSLSLVNRRDCIILLSNEQLWCGSKYLRELQANYSKIIWDLRTFKGLMMGCNTSHGSFVILCFLIATTTTTMTLARVGELCRPIMDTSNFTFKFWRLDGIVNCLIWSTMVSNGDYWDAIHIRGESDFLNLIFFCF